MNLELARDEALILRAAAYLYTATCAVNREEARHNQDARQQAYWSERHDAVKALGDRLEALLSGSTPAQSPAEPDTSAGDPALTRACDSCGAPLRTDETVPLCPVCRTKLRQVLAEEVL